MKAGWGVAGSGRLILDLVHAMLQVMPNVERHAQPRNDRPRHDSGYIVMAMNKVVTLMVMHYHTRNVAKQMLSKLGAPKQQVSRRRGITHLQGSEDMNDLIIHPLSLSTSPATRSLRPTMSVAMYSCRAGCARTRSNQSQAKMQ